MLDRIKKQASTLSKELNIPHQKALDLASRLNSFRDYHHATQEQKAKEKPVQPFQLAEPFQNLEEQLIAMTNRDVHLLGLVEKRWSESSARQRESWEQLVDQAIENGKKAMEVADTWRNRYEELKKSISGDQFYPPSRENSSTLQN